ncbi:MAG: CHAP domain-containing protein, partial [Lentihominibacter sp.]
MVSNEKFMTIAKQFIIFAVVCIVCLSVATIPSYATSKTQNQAIDWAKSKVGKSLDYDKAYGAQCVDLIKYYYKYLGVSPVKGNGCDYVDNKLPKGWHRYKNATPKKGDILVYSGPNKNGHVAIFESTNITYHQNYPKGECVRRYTNKNYKKYGNYWGVIRPNFKNTSSKVTSAPKNLKATKGKYGDTVTFTWSKVTNATNYW